MAVGEPDLFAFVMGTVLLLNQIFEWLHELFEMKNGQAHLDCCTHELHQRANRRSFMHVDWSFKFAWDESDIIFVIASATKVEVIEHKLTFFWMLLWDFLRAYLKNVAQIFGLHFVARSEAQNIIQPHQQLEMCKHWNFRRLNILQWIRGSVRHTCWKDNPKRYDERFASSR